MRLLLPVALAVSGIRCDETPFKDKKLIVLVLSLSCAHRSDMTSGGMIVLGKLPAPGRPTIWMTVGQEPIVLAVGAEGGCLYVFTLLYPFSSLSPYL